MPCDCLGSIWTQRNKKGNEHLAPTVRATIAQFNQVANCVITTCLGVPGMRAIDRAKTVEHWIKVARVSCDRALTISLEIYDLPLIQQILGLKDFSEMYNPLVLPDMGPA